MLNIGTGEKSLIHFSKDLLHTTSFTIPRPSDFHAHFRVDEIMGAVALEIMRHVRYGLAMPNNGIQGPGTVIRTIMDAHAYHADLLDAIRHKINHTVGIIMTFYHTADITPAVIEEMAKSVVVRAIKHYPPHPGATTGSGHGLPLSESGEMLRAMEQNGVPLLGHFESIKNANGTPLPPEAGEEYFVHEHLWRIRDEYPNLRICFEHASTEAAVEFVKADPTGRTIMTVTPHHMLFTTPDLQLRSWGRHLLCKPIVQSEKNRAAIHAFATSGDRRVCAGTDTAPHLRRKKEDVPYEQTAFGAYVPHAIALYVHAFEKVGALDDRMVHFLSLNGPAWWGLLPPASDDLLTVRVAAASEDIPEPTKVEMNNREGDDDVIIPLGWTPELNSDAFHPGFLCEGAPAF